ncbi:MAG: 2-C-methyl-D-erythritol 2,4-cyclodiphosphate synthase [Clostridia bacterium]|nr:2-C-methyl-D-erythritol 2,4-cyclodiphosphate synthase [Clostridia bacterium]
MDKKIKITAVIPSAGQGKRSKQKQNKIFSLIGGVPVILKTVSAFSQIKKIDEIIVVYSQGEEDKLKEILSQIEKPIRYVSGGETRFDSVKNALDTIDDGAVLIHDGARPFISERDISAVIKSVLVNGTGVLATPLTDTVLETDGNVTIFASGRKNKLSALTPQGFMVNDIKKAYAHASASDGFTDDAGIYSATLGKCTAVLARDDNKKLTYPEDFESLPTYSKCGTGFDLHKLVENRKLILGGIEIPNDKGLLGHSDADVLTHAIMDALLSSASMRDIGYHFSDKDPKYKGVSSMKLLEEVMKMLKLKGLKPVHVSAVVMAEKPKLSPYRDVITKNLATALELSEDCVGITFTTLEGIGTVGREEGIASQAFVLTRQVISPKETTNG